MLRVCNSTNKEDRYRYGGRNIRAEKHRFQEDVPAESDGRSRTNGKVSERVGGRKRWLEYACASDSKMTIMLILWLSFESVNSCSNRLIAIGKCVRGMVGRMHL